MPLASKMLTFIMHSFDAC